MPARRLRRFVLLVVLAVLVAKVLDALRGDPAPAFSRHPSVDGGDRRSPSTPVVADPATSVDTAGTGSIDDTGTGDAPDAAAIAADGPEGPHLGPAPSAPVTPPAAADGPHPLTDPDHAWVDPVDGACPPGFPVKAKLRSGIYHLPGMAAYERTVPDRCYPTAETAADDGLRAAKR